MASGTVMECEIYVCQPNPTQKWKRCGLGEKIPVDPDHFIQLWRVEKNSQYWRFYLQTEDGPKIYITYDGTAITHQFPKMELSGPLRQIDFIATEKRGGVYVFQSMNAPYRYLQYRGGLLAMSAPKKTTACDCEPTEWLLLNIQPVN